MDTSSSTAVSDEVGPIFFVFQASKGDDSAWAPQAHLEVIAPAQPFVLLLIVCLQRVHAKPQAADMNTAKTALLLDCCRAEGQPMLKLTLLQHHCHCQDLTNNKGDNQLSKFGIFEVPH